jgi:type IV secretion system protein VirB4
LFDAIRTIRKRGGAFIGATQSITEIVKQPMLCNVLLESCPGKLFFPNPELRNPEGKTYDEYRRLGLPDHLLATLGSASRKRHFLYTSPEHSRLAALPLGNVARRICGSTDWKQVRAFRDILDHPNGSDVLTRWLAG